MNQTRDTRGITKILSANDTGDTGGHQAGILVPKLRDILSFFPAVDARMLNPRHHLVFHDGSGGRWEFAFIYYNNRFFGGTRNEYRLTRMTEYIRRHNLKPGDVVTLTRLEGGRRMVSCSRAKVAARSTDGVLRLGSSWKVIEF